MKIKKIAALILPAAIMALIFYFSSQNADTSSKTSGGIAEFIARVFCDTDKLYSGERVWVINTLQVIIRKGAHFTIYMILGFFMANLMGSFGIRYWFSPIICFIYAVSDEIHQYFVPGRSCEIRDMFIDLSGSILGTLAFVLTLRIVRRIKNGWSL